jgi:hypothetical protein
MAILSSTEYPAIRAALDVSLNAQTLPDATIAQGIFVGAAEAEVLRRVPDAESKTGDDLARVKRAAIWLAAAYLAHSVVRLTSLSVQTRDLSYSRQTFNPDEKAAELRARAEREFGMLLAPLTVTPSRPTMFTTVGGRRGW